MRVIVIGANSYIGSHLVKKLKDCGHTVIAVVNTSREQTEWLSTAYGIQILNNPVSLDTEGIDRIFFCNTNTGFYDYSITTSSKYDKYMDERSVLLSTTLLYDMSSYRLAYKVMCEHRERNAQKAGAVIVRLCNVVGWDLPYTLKQPILGHRSDLQSSLRRHLMKPMGLDEIFYFSEDIDTKRRYIDIGFVTTALIALLDAGKTIKSIVLYSKRSISLREIGESLPCRYSTKSPGRNMLVEIPIGANENVFYQEDYISTSVAESLSNVYAKYTSAT